MPGGDVLSWDSRHQPDPSGRYSPNWGYYTPPLPFLGEDSGLQLISPTPIGDFTFKGGSFPPGSPLNPLQGQASDFADGGSVSPAFSMTEPSSDLIDMTVASLKGQTNNPEAIIARFVKKYGPDALSALSEDIVDGGDGSFLRGPGDGRADDIPGLVDGVSPVALSSGEFVVPKDVVENIGGGSTDEGASRLMAMGDRVRRETNDMIGNGRRA